MSWFEHLHSANWNQISGIGLGAYLLGCFTAGYYLVRMRLGRDIRELGSGSAGAKNVWRVFGTAGFLLTVFFDVGKGAFAVWAAGHFTADNRLLGLAMVAVVAGHIWPVQLRFRGGKGIATSVGALLIYDVHLLSAVAVVFLFAFALSRRTVLPGLFAFSCLTPVSFFLERDPATVTVVSILTALVLIAHRKNLAEELLQLARRFHHPKPDQTRL